MTRTIRKTRVAFAALALAGGLGLTACGEDAPDAAEDPSSSETPSASTSETPSETPSEEPTEEPAGPACADVWVAGATLPQKYDGCQDAEKDKWMQAMIYHCSSGQRLVTFGRTFYAAKGEVITESETPLARNPEFKKVMASCGA
jgi:hypothetical protein